MNNISRNIILTVFCLVGFISSIYVRAQHPTDKVYISGHIENEKETMGKGKIGISGPTRTISPLREKGNGGGYSDSLDTENRFSFEFNNKDLFYSGTDSLSKGQITFSFKDKQFYLTMQNYAIEPGDSVYITVKIGEGQEVEISFLGKGVEKYQCRREIEEILGQSFYLNKDIRKSTIEDFEQGHQFYQTQESRVLKILQQYKDKINNEAYTLLKADAIAKIQGQWLTSLWNFYENSTNVSKKELLEVAGYTKGIEVQKVYNENDPYVVLSPDYVNYLALYVSFEKYLENNGEVPSIQDLSSAVMEKYSGPTLEYLLLMFLKNNYISYPFDSRFGLKYANVELYSDFINKISPLIKNPYIRKQITSKTLIKTGVPAYDFAFTNPSGNLVKLEDFRGKTVLMDLWFTGCGGCAQFAKYVGDHIKPEFGENKDFIIVSISTDKEKEKWLKSLESEIYSEKENVNLYTNGEGFGHEIIDYYSLDGLPFALLIDKDGKVVSHLSLGMDPKQVKKLIRKSLRR